MENQMNVIVLAAGRSSRFPHLPPKYLLQSRDNRRMIEYAVECFDRDTLLHIVILADHCREHQADVILTDLFPNLKLIVLDHPTNGPAETALLAMIQQSIAGPVYIKDCDTFFRMPIPRNNNAIAVVDLHAYPLLRNIASKSFVRANDQGIIQSIIEKQVVSNLISVGGYQFENADVFVQETQHLLSSWPKELYISNVIDALISDGHVFEAVPVTEMIDVGTIDDWREWNNYSTATRRAWAARFMGSLNSAPGAPPVVTK